MKDADQERALACYQRQKDTVYKLAWTYCGDKCWAEDIFQEVFYKYLIYNPKFKSPEHEKAWFIRTTINLCKNLLKSKWQRDVLRLEEWDGSLADLQENGNAFEALREAVLNLPDKYRVPIHLYYYEDYSVREIAGLLRKSESTIQTQLQRGREKIRQTMERSGGHEFRA